MNPIRSKDPYLCKVEKKKSTYLSTRMELSIYVVNFLNMLLINNKLTILLILQSSEAWSLGVQDTVKIYLTKFKRIDTNISR